MEFQQVIKALNSEFRIFLLSLLFKSPKSLNEILSDLSKTKYSKYYRTSTYRALETLVAANLVSKIYVKNKGISYDSKYTKITLNLEKNKVEIPS